MTAGRSEPLAALLRELVPSVAEGCALYARDACIAGVGMLEGRVRTAFPVPFEDGVAELVVWSDAPLVRLAASWARSVAAHAGTHLTHEVACLHARACEAERDRALTTIGHELRTPLQTLTTGIHLLLTRLRSTADEVPPSWLVARCEQLERSVARLVSLSDDLLEASRPQAHAESSPAERVDAGALVDEIVASTIDEATWADCEISVRRSGSLEGRWSRVQLERVLSNLLANARKYGAGRPILVEADGADEGVTIRVRDHGRGIPLHDVPRIFERFYRGENAPYAAGLGVGLWIVDGLVRSLGGTIACESVLGEGSTFTVFLPHAQGGALSASSPGPAASPFRDPAP